MTDKIRLRGEIHIARYDGDLPQMSSTELADFLDGRYPVLRQQRLMDYRVVPNLVTNAGRAQAVNMLLGLSTQQMQYHGISTGVTAPAFTDVAMPSQLFRKQVSILTSINTYFIRTATYHAPSDWASTSITGGGIFDAATTGGVMWAEAVFALSKTASQAASIDWRLNVST